KNRCTGDDAASQRTPSAPDLVVVLGPLRFDDVADDQSSVGEGTHPVADRVVGFHVQGAPVLVLLHIGAAVEIGVAGLQSVFPRTVGKAPADRVADRNASRPPGRSTRAASASAVRISGM